MNQQSDVNQIEKQKLECNNSEVKRSILDLKIEHIHNNEHKLSGEIINIQSSDNNTESNNTAK